MDKVEPEYMQLNPMFNGLKVDVMTSHKIVLEQNFYGDIQMKRVKIPVKMYLNTQNKDDMSDIKNYHLNAFLGSNFQ
jgi:hypothetical protein